MKDMQQENSMQNDNDESMVVSQVEENGRLSYEEQVKYVNPIASPLASRKLAKKLYKLIKKVSKEKDYFFHGLKTVQNQIVKKGATGIVVFAGDITPIEIMCHLPAICEEKNIPYIYTPSSSDLGLAMGVKRCSLMALIKEHPNYKELYDECYQRVQSASISVL